MVADFDRRYQRRVRADKSVIADLRFEFVDPVIVAGDGARTYIGFFADGGIADVAQVIYLTAFTNDRFLGLHKVTDLSSIRQLCSRTQARKRTDIAVASDNGIFNVTVRFDVSVVANTAVDDDAVGLNRYTIAQYNITFKYAVDINHHIAANLQITTAVEPGRVQEGCTGDHQFTGFLPLIKPLQCSLLLTVVDTFHFFHRTRLFYLNAHAALAGEGDDVRQIVFALGIIVAQLGQPLLQVLRFYRHDAGIDFVDPPLFFIGILVLDDGCNRTTGIAQDTTVTRRIGKVHSQQPHLLVVHMGDQFVQGFGAGQRYVAIKNQHCRFTA